VLLYAQAEAALALASEQQLALRQAQAMVLRGWALVMQGQAETGMTQLQQGLAAVRATGEGIERPYRLALLAEACGQSGQPAVGVQVLTEALALSRTSGEHRWEAELHRLHGELLLARGGEGHGAHAAEAAEACFQQALATARRQQAKSLALRSAVSLSRLWQRQGKRAAGRELLASVYEGFTEGGDTPDLREATALLEELRA
jgi:predicted ATPase